MSTGNEDVTDPQDTSTAAVCRALTISPDGTYSEENECDCPRCEPANDAFIPRSDIDPHRRIVRARRPPQAASSSSSTAAAPFGSEGNFISNATTTTTSESAVHAQNLSSAINILHQLNNNNNNGRPSRGTAVQQVVSDSDDESMPPLEDIGPPESNGGASNVNPLNTNSNNSTIRRRVGNGANTNSFSALGEDDDSEENEDELARGARFLGVADDDSDEDYDDDDESFGGPPIPSQMFQGFLSHMNEMAARASRRPRQHLNSRIAPDDDNEESENEEEYNEGSTAQRCAACFRIDNPSHKWRRLVTLPCCGTNGRERNSSTRFCAACILKLAVTRADSANTGEYQLYDDEPDEYPVRKFYAKNTQTDNRRFCECPRCRDVLLVKIKGIKTVIEKNDSEDESDCDCDCSDCERERQERRANRRDSKTAKSISVHIPSFKAKCWYIGRKKGIAKLLWKVSLLHHNFLSYEALGGDDERGVILKAAGYGIIERIPGKRNTKVYRIDKANQTKLIKFFRLPAKVSEKDQKSEMNLLTDLQTSISYAAWRHLRDEWRIDRSLRMLNRFFFISFHYFGYLPPLPLSSVQELVVTALVLFGVSLVFQFLCVLAVYAAVFFGVGLSTCYVLKRSNNIKSCWWQAILLSYFVYRVNKFFHESSWLSWGTLIAPKALIPLKKLLWG